MDGPLRVEVSLDTDASDEEIAAVRNVLAEVGLEADISNNYETKALDLTPWIVHIGLVGGGVYLAAFLKRLGELNAESANEAFKRLPRRLAAARAKSNRPQGTPTLWSERPEDLGVVLQADLPEKAMEQLLDGDFPGEAESGQLRFDFSEERWRDAWEIPEE